MLHDDIETMCPHCGKPFSPHLSWTIINVSHCPKKIQTKCYINIICSSLLFSMRILFFSLCPSNCTSLLQNLILINNLVNIFECLFFYMNLISNYLEFGNCRFNFTDNIVATTCLYSHFVTSLH